MRKILLIVFMAGLLSTALGHAPHSKLKSHCDIRELLQLESGLG
jgi:hypothetical protein